MSIEKAERDILILFAFVAGALISGILVGFTVEHRTEVRAAENNGFSIGSGVLEQQWHCTEITNHTGIESAKAQVSAYQTMVRG